MQPYMTQVNNSSEESFHHPEITFTPPSGDADVEAPVSRITATVFIKQLPLVWFLKLGFTRTADSFIQLWTLTPMYKRMQADM